MSFSIATSTLVALLLCSVRILAWVSIAPPFATGGIPRTVKTALAVALSLVVTPAMAAHAPPADAVPLVTTAVEQVLIGAGLGLATRLVFTAVESAGSLIDLFGGFTVAFAFDPLSQSSNSVFGRFYGLLCTTLIFVTPAHLLIVAGFMRSFQSIPLDGHISTAKLAAQLIPGLTTMFVSALQIAGPLIIVLFLADMCMGLLNRIAPQLNVFSLSFPLKIILTLGLVGLGFALLPATITHLAGQAVNMAGLVMG
jgi:flagellar biosynthetic protein FliR